MQTMRCLGTLGAKACTNTRYDDEQKWLVTKSIAFVQLRSGTGGSSITCAI